MQQSIIWLILQQKVKGVSPHQLPLFLWAIVLRFNSNQQLPRMFLKENYVYQLFDTEEDFINISLVEKLLDDVEVQSLSKDQRFMYIRYKYVKGSHEMKHYAQVIPILQQLIELHAEGIVHSDVRTTNIVFSDDGRTATLIDFDLAAKEGTLYPETYNAFLPERHDSAQGMLTRKREHDCHSLSVILAQTRFFSPKILERVCKGELFKAAEELKSMLGD